MSTVALSGLRGRSVLVTGATGLLGSWLSAALVDGGARVVALRRDQPAISALELLGVAGRVDIVSGDVCDERLVARTLGEYEVDSVFHLAAQTLVPVANRAPSATYETNVRGTWTVLEACRSHGVRAVIVASSDKAYGRQDRLPYREDQPLRAAFPYDVSKAAADLIARSYWHTFGVPAAVTRCANLYGGADLNRSRLVPEAVAAALGGRAPVIRSDGSPERDFLYVADAVAACLAIWGAVSDGVPGAAGEAFNAGGGRPHRVGDVVALISRLTGAAAAPRILGHGVPEGEIDRQWVDASKLTRLTGWRPRIGLEQGLAATLDWYRAHPEALSRLV